MKKGSKRILNGSLDAGRQKVGNFIKGGKKDGVIVESNKSGLWPTPTKKFDGKSGKDFDRQSVNTKTTKGRKAVGEVNKIMDNSVLDSSPRHGVGEIVPLSIRTEKSSKKIDKSSLAKVQNSAEAKLTVNNSNSNCDKVGKIDLCANVNNNDDTGKLMQDYGQQVNEFPTFRNINVAGPCPESQTSTPQTSQNLFTFTKNSQNALQFEATDSKNSYYLQQPQLPGGHLLGYSSFNVQHPTPDNLALLKTHSEPELSNPENFLPYQSQPTHQKPPPSQYDSRRPFDSKFSFGQSPIDQPQAPHSQWDQIDDQ